MKARTLALVVFVALSGWLTPARGSDRGTIYSTLAADERTTVLAVAAKEAGAIALLKGKEEYTLFAPTDAAFRKLGDEAIGQIAGNANAVEKLLRAHLVKGKFTTAALKKKAAAGETLTTVSGEQLKIEDRKDGLFVGGVKVETSDLECSNGVVHVLGGVRVAPKE